MRYGDYEKPPSLENAFSGIDRLFIVSSGHLPNEQRIEQHKNALNAAVEAGVQQLYYTSFFNAEASSRFHFAEVHRQTEEAIKASSIPAYTIFRDAWYADLFLEGIEQTLEEGKLYAAAGSGRINSIPRAEIALAIAITLAAGGHESQIYEFTGPEIFTYADAATWLSEAFGRAVNYVDLSIEEALEHFGGKGAGQEDEMLQGIVSSYEAMRANEYARVSDDFQKITGRPPLAVREFLKEQANKEPFSRLKNRKEV